VFGIKLCFHFEPGEPVLVVLTGTSASSGYGSTELCLDGSS
jgi:hypothetical protein